MDESWAQWSLSRGVESLPESIAAYLQQSGRVQLHRDAAVQLISPSASGWKVSEETINYECHVQMIWFSIAAGYSPCQQN